MRKKLNDCVSTSDVKSVAKQKIPKVSWEYLETGTGQENLLDVNRQAFNNLGLYPEFMKGDLVVDTTTSFLSSTYAVPFGIAPIGLSGLIWPKSEIFLAQSSMENNFPFCLSTVATETPETISEFVGPNGWFQLYPPNDFKLLEDLLNRAWKSEFKTLVVTADVPSPSVRERSQRAGMKMPLKLNFKLIFEALQRPKWTLHTLRRGLPRLRTLEEYTTHNNLNFVANYAGNRLGGTLDWQYLERLRELWRGKIILKGIISPKDAIKAVESKNCDAIIVSNHGARQFDGGVASLHALTEIRKALGDEFPLILDSGIETGIDIIKALNQGANFVLLGRTFMHGAAAFQKKGVDKIFQILKRDLVNGMHQIGVECIEEIRTVKHFNY